MMVYILWPSGNTASHINAVTLH